MKITRALVEAEFPYPISTGDHYDPKKHSKGIYCVGGGFIGCYEKYKGNRVFVLREGQSHGQAVIEYLTSTRIFPTINTLVEFLKKENPELDNATAVLCAGKIINNNDAGNFDEAWAWLEKAIG